MPPRTLSAVDLFAGAGGLSLGLAAAGFTVHAAVESDPQAAETYRLNHMRTRVVDTDMRSVEPASLFPDRRRRLDLLAGGPPCQGFSIKGQRRIGHPGNAMLDQLLRAAAELRPRAVLVENVVGLTSMLGGFYFDRLITGLERIDLGEGRRYDVDYTFLNAAHHGTPQNRRRLFVVAVEPGRRFSWPEPTTQPGDLTLWDAISDLPPEAVRPGETTSYTRRQPSRYAAALRAEDGVVLNHHTKRLEETRQKRLGALAEGQDRRHLPEELQAGGHESKYRRLRADAACPTLTAHMGKDLSDFIHPRLGRTLTAREAARVQGFPDWMEFAGSQASQLNQIGNAVPIPLATAVGRALAEALRAPGRAGRPRRTACATQ